MNRNTPSALKTVSHPSPFVRRCATFLMCFVGLAVFACAPKDGIPPAQQAAAEQDEFAGLDADEKEIVSESLADDGEEKLTFATLEEAWSKFNDAIKLNPENQRAIFWKEALKPMRRMKGIVGRIRPLYLSQENGAERYHKFLNGLRKSSNQEYYRYISEGAGDMSTDAEFRQWMDLLILDLDALRTFLKTNKDREYRLRAPVKFLSGSATVEKQSGCAALRVMTSKFAGCPSSGILNFKVNRADIEAMNGSVAYTMLALSVMYAYNFNPVVLFLNSDNVTAKDLLDNMAQGYEGGLLERNHLHLAPSVFGDWLVAQRYFVQNQKEVCRNGEYADDNRPGFLMSQGFCLDTRPGGDGNKSLDMLEMIVQGQPVNVDMEFAERPLAVYPLKFFASPPKDGKSLLPVTYNKDEKPYAFYDVAYSPYFAAGSIGDVMKYTRTADAVGTLPYQDAEAFRKRFKELRDGVPSGRPVAPAPEGAAK